MGESIADLRDFDATDFAAALIGDFDDRYDEDSEHGGGSTKIASLEDDAPHAGEDGDAGDGAGVDDGLNVDASDVPEAPADVEALSEDAERDLEERVEELSAVSDADGGSAGGDGEAAPVSLEDVREDGFEADDSEFTDEELAELAMMASVDDADAQPEPEPEPEPKRKKHFWEKWW